MTDATIVTPSLEARTICQLEGDLRYLRDVGADLYEQACRTGDTGVLASIHETDHYALVTGIIRKAWAAEGRDFDAYLAEQKAAIAAWQAAPGAPAV